MPRKSKTLTWFDFIEKAAMEHSNITHPQMEGLKNIISIDTQFNDLFYHSIPAIYLLDYTTGKYITMSKSSEVAVGVSAKNFLEGGIAFTIENYHADDLKLYNEKIFPDRLSMLNNFDKTDYHRYVFTYTFRLKNSDGSYTNLLQRNCFIQSGNNNVPLASFGIVVNIGHFRNENPVIQTVEKLNNSNLPAPAETVSKKCYFLRDEDQLFSKREKEVLQCTADGLTSKNIALRLGISESTVINHRKSMLLKSGAKNLAELVAFSVRNTII